MPKPWKTLSSEQLVTHPYIGVRRERCLMPDGRVNDSIYMLDHPDWVQAFAMTTDGRVVMVRQYRHGTGRVGVEFPAGCMEGGEMPEHAAARELREETGYVSDTPPVVLACVDTNPALCGNKLYVCLIRGAVKTADVEFDEFEDVETFTKGFDEVGDMIRSGEITHIHTRFAYGVAREYLGR